MEEAQSQLSTPSDDTELCWTPDTSATCEGYKEVRESMAPAGTHSWMRRQPRKQTVIMQEALK